MSIRVPSHLYRNRHGTFYFRLTIPKALRTVAGRDEVRFSLECEQRSTAIIRALHFIADLPRLAVCLQRMAEQGETPPTDFFKLWNAYSSDRGQRFHSDGGHRSALMADSFSHALMPLSSMS